jgi:hypothetical protein
MSDIYLPPHIVRQQRQEFEAKILRNVTIEDARAREFTEALQKINPDMFMVRAHDTIDADVPLSGPASTICSCATRTRR